MALLAILALCGTFKKPADWPFWPVCPGTFLRTALPWLFGTVRPSPGIYVSNLNVSITEYHHYYLEDTVTFDLYRIGITDGIS